MSELLIGAALVLAAYLIIVWLASRIERNTPAECGEYPLDPDQPQPTAGGLTLRELRADVASAGHEVDPTHSPTTLLALRARARA